MGREKEGTQMTADIPTQADDNKPEGRKWAGTTMGNSWMHEKLIGILRHVDVRVLYAFVDIFVIPVCLLTMKSRHTAYEYFRRRHGYGRIRAAWATYVNHCKFGAAVVDKFAMFAGKEFDIKVEGYKNFAELEGRDEAFVQLSSHIGNFEIAGFSLKSERKTIHALVFGGEKASVMAQRSRLLKQHNIRIIPTSDDMSHVFELNNALAEGHIVTMPADRIVGSAKSVEATILGTKAKLPIGPYLTPIIRGLDVLSVNVMKTSVKGYTIFIERLHYDRAAPRDKKIEQLAAAYAAQLEKMLKMYPTQWYNFFDFWGEDSATSR